MPSHVPNATTDLTENGGGVISPEQFSCSAAILQKPKAIYGFPLKGGPENEPIRNFLKVLTFSISNLFIL